MPESTAPDSPAPDASPPRVGPPRAGECAGGTSGPGATPQPAVERKAAAEVVVTNPQGLHLRPATEFARQAQASGCRVRVCCAGAEGDGASVLELAMMAIRPGALLRIVVTGPGCEQALADLVALVERDFRD